MTGGLVYRFGQMPLERLFEREKSAYLIRHSLSVATSAFIGGYELDALSKVC